MLAIEDSETFELRAGLKSIHRTDACLSVSQPLCPSSATSITGQTGRMARSHFFCVYCVLLGWYRCTHATHTWRSEGAPRCGSSLPPGSQQGLLFSAAKQGKLARASGNSVSTSHLALGARLRLHAGASVSGCCLSVLGI